MLSQIRKDKNKKFIFIRFNAWEYSGSDILWAGLIKQIYEDVEKEFTSFITRFFRYIIYPFRDKSKSKKQKIYLGILWIIKLILLFFSIIAGYYFMSLLFSNNTNNTNTIYNITNIEHIDNIDNTENSNMGSIIVSGSIFGISFLSILPYLIKVIINIVSNRVLNNLKSIKNIEDQIGFMADVKNEVEILSDFMDYNNYGIIWRLSYY